MIKKMLFLGACAALLSTTTAQAVPDPLLLNDDSHRKIALNNRILAKVNGKALSVLDVMKKMDMLFYRQYPQYSSSVSARFQFYQMSWKSVLQQMIDKELILADAEELKMIVNHGDVRQEIEETFGPNIVVNLDASGLTYEEAFQMIKDELILRRMMYFRVNSKAVQSVTPQDVRLAYAEYIKDNIQPDIWYYRVISIRGHDATKTTEMAKHAHELLVEKHLPVQELADNIKKSLPPGSTIQINVSDENQHLEKDLSPAYKEILATLESDSYSQPIPQKSRKKGESISRIFYLQKIDHGTIPTFPQVETQLKGKLIDKIVDQETEVYIKRLRKHYHVQELFVQDLSAEEFQPFILQ